MNNNKPPFPIINLNQPDNVDDVFPGDVMMTERLRKLLHRRRELMAEGQEIERELRVIEREIHDHRWSALEAAAEKDLLSA